MIEINLLPWRELAYLRKQQNFCNAILAGMSFCVILFATHYCILNSALNKKIRNIQQLNDQMIIMSTQQNNLDADVQTNFAQKIVQSEQNRQAWLDSIRKISHLAELQLQLLKISDSKRGIDVVGLTPSLKVLSLWMKTLGEAKIVELRQNKYPDLLQFHVLILSGIVSS